MSNLSQAGGMDRGHQIGCPAFRPRRGAVCACAPRRVRYMESADPSMNQARVNWGSNDDPRGLLKVGAVYTLASMEVHTWHTKYVLAEFPGKKFNSNHFEDVEA